LKVASHLEPAYIQHKNALEKANFIIIIIENQNTVAEDNYIHLMAEQ